MITNNLVLKTLFYFFGFLYSFSQKWLVFYFLFVVFLISFYCEWKKFFDSYPLIRGFVSSILLVCTFFFDWHSWGAALIMIGCWILSQFWIFTSKIWFCIFLVCVIANIFGMLSIVALSFYICFLWIFWNFVSHYCYHILTWETSKQKIMFWNWKAPKCWPWREKEKEKYFEKCLEQEKEKENIETKSEGCHCAIEKKKRRRRNNWENPEDMYFYP
jgi:hypothetical protein